MPAIIGIDHIYITVSDLQRSELFYDTLMAILGFRKNRFILDNDEHIQYVNRVFGYVLRPAHSRSKYDSYAPGLHHFCMRVDSPDDVLVIYNKLNEKGIQLSKPKRYPEYADDYFAVFLKDPDGIELEITNFRMESRARFDNWRSTP